MARRFQATISSIAATAATFALATTYAVDRDDWSCSSQCSGGAVHIANMKWTSDDSFLSDLENEQLEEEQEDELIYSFGGQCPRRADDSACDPSKPELCFKSWPAGDEDKWRSEDAMCRTVPDAYIEGPFEYSRRPMRNQNAGLCKLGCEADEVCHKSWLAGDELKGRSPSAMGRCKPAN